MTVGQAVTAVTSTADDASLLIQPTSGVEWIIHNIAAPDDAEIEIYFTDGTNDILVLSNIGGYIDGHFHVTNSKYYKIKNVSGGTIYLGYDGIISYEA